MVHAGLGFSQVQSLFTELNLPMMSKTTLGRHEKKISAHLTEIAENSCKEAQQIEKQLSLNKVHICINLNINNFI